MPKWKTKSSANFSCADDTIDKRACRLLSTGDKPFSHNLWGDGCKDLVFRGVHVSVIPLKRNQAGSLWLPAKKDLMCYIALFNQDI